MNADPLDELRRHQDGKCAICQQARTLVVDHDHKTGMVRGLLCYRCNTSEGAGLDYPWMVAYRADPPAAALGLVVKYGEHCPRPSLVPQPPAGPTSLTAEDARRQFADILNRAQAGEHIVVTRNGRPAGVFVPLTWFDEQVASQPELAEQQP